MKTFISIRSTVVISVAIFISLGLASCIRKSTAPTPTVAVPSPVLKTPEEVVKHFIQISASAKNDTDRKNLEELCSGEMRRAFDKMSADSFRVAYLNNNVKLTEIKIIEARVQNEIAVVRYQVSLDNSQGTDITKESVEREVELSQIQGTWLISSIRPKGSDKIAFTRGMIF